MEEDVVCTLNRSAIASVDPEPLRDSLDFQDFSLHGYADQVVTRKEKEKGWVIETWRCLRWISLSVTNGTARRESLKID
jgi:hypothetical protein